MRHVSFILCLALLLLAAVAFRTTQAQSLLICRAGTVQVLAGNGPPHSAVLLLFDSTPVGGSTTDERGKYEVQLRVGPEAPGDYPVEVQVRSSRQVLQTALCRVPGPDETDSPVVAAPLATTSVPRATTSTSSAPQTTSVGGTSPTTQAATSIVGVGTTAATSTTRPSSTSGTSVTTPSLTASASPSLTATNQGGATSTPSATGQRATNTSLPTATQTSTNGSLDLTIDVDDDEPDAGVKVLTSGDVSDANGDGVNNALVTVTYSFGSTTGAWCSKTTDSDGYWECEGTVTQAMIGKEVTLTAKVSVNGQTKTEMIKINPGGEST